MPQPGASPHPTQWPPREGATAAYGHARDIAPSGYLAPAGNPEWPYTTMDKFLAFTRLVHRFESGWERHKNKGLADAEVRRVKTM
jgi:hypothetical protein